MSKHTIDRQALAMRIRQLEGLTNDEKAALLELLNTQKRYGLVWEDKPEQVEEELRSKIPVFTEVKDRAIINDTPTEHYPNHLLIEGDNLQALTTLAYTHEGKIDVIYIDPPYNTLKDEKDDFTYNDKKIDKTDSFPHSKWLSFMKSRLTISKRLLSDGGKIFISIDDHEFANLKLLMDDIYGENNFLCNIIWNSTKSVTNTAIVSVAHTYNLVYFKNIDYIIENRTEFRLPENGDGFSNPDNDPRGVWKGDPFQVGGWRPNQQYEIVNPNTGVVYKPNEGCSWKNDYEHFKLLVEEKRIVFGKNGNGAPLRKRFLHEAESRGRVVKTIWDDIETTTNGTSLLKSIFSGVSPFSNPKPIELLNRILCLGSTKSSTILDFFAGSGTTLHATMQLNAEDGGQRQCILVTNNENKICEEVTYERNKRVINGYTTPKGEKVEGLHHNNLRYYKTELVERENSQQNRRALMKASADLLCIKEDIYTEKDELNGTKFNKQYIRFYQDGDRSMLLVFDPRAIDSVVERLGGMAFVRPVKVYVYSADEYPYTDDFAPVADKVQLVALPTALRKALQNVLPADGPQRPVEGMEPAADATADGDLFNQSTGEE